MEQLEKYGALLARLLLAGIFIPGGTLSALCRHGQGTMRAWSGHHAGTLHKGCRHGVATMRVWSLSVSRAVGTTRTGSSEGAGMVGGPCARGVGTMRACSASMSSWSGKGVVMVRRG